MKHLLTIVLTLTLLTCCTTPARREAMRHGLDSINVRNRTDQPFTTADVQPYVDFFDRHGTANDRLLAHYLLGRAYHEQGEAPMALQCYQQAIECADTTAADCDYAQMSRVYGQIAEVLYDQGLYREQLFYDRLAEMFAWQGRDTLAALMCLEQQGQAFEEIGYADSAFARMEEAAEKYRMYGYSAYAASATGSLAFSMLRYGRTEKIGNLLEIYESESGHFEQGGHINNGKEVYYYAKGLLKLKENHIDSAEYWFRKELHDGKDFNNQNGGAMGLAMVYEQRHMPDSAAKYYKYAYAMNDSMYAQQATKTVSRMQAMYDYSRHQEMARSASDKATMANMRLLVSLIVLLVISLLASWLYIARKRVIEEMQASARPWERPRMIWQGSGRTHSQTSRPSARRKRESDSWRKRWADMANWCSSAQRG